MSTQGGTLRAPIHMPLRPVIATLVATVAALGIGLGVRELVREPARTSGAVVEFDWGSQVGHPQIRHAEASRMPEQRIYPDGFGEAAQDEGSVVRIWTHQQI